MPTVTFQGFVCSSRLTTEALQDEYRVEGIFRVQKEKGAANVPPLPLVGCKANNNRTGVVTHG